MTGNLLRLMILAVTTTGCAIDLDDTEAGDDIGSTEQAVTSMVRAAPQYNALACEGASGEGCDHDNCWDSSKILWNGSCWQGKKCYSHAITRAHDQCYTNVGAGNLSGKHSTDGNIAAELECGGYWFGLFAGSSSFAAPEGYDFFGLGACFSAGWTVIAKNGSISWCKCKDVGRYPSGGAAMYDYEAYYAGQGYVPVTLTGDVVFGTSQSPPTPYDQGSAGYTVRQGNKRYYSWDYSCDRAAAYSIHHAGWSWSTTRSALENWPNGTGGPYDAIITFPQQQVPMSYCGM
jgi:hypothetical protein